MYLRPDDLHDHGIIGAELVVEIRSPGDETYVKADYYAARGIGEFAVIHRDRRIEFHRLREGRYVVLDVARSEALGCTFTTAGTAEEPKLRIEWEGGAAEV